MVKSILRFIGTIACVGFLLFSAFLAMQQQIHMKALLFRQTQEVQAVGGVVVQSERAYSSWPTVIDLRKAKVPKEWLLESMNKPEYFNAEELLLTNEQLSADEIASLRARHPGIRVKVDD